MESHPAYHGPATGFARDRKTDFVAEDDTKMVFGRLNHIGYIGEEESLCGEVRDPNRWSTPQPDGPVCRKCVEALVNLWNM